jgi:hypothetical protein
LGESKGKFGVFRKTKNKKEVGTKKVERKEKT